MKQFFEWIHVKKKIDGQTHNPPFVSEGDIWWCHVGENVGTEVGGKSDKFTRPVIILKRFGPSSFLGIPLTSNRRSGDWYITFRHRGILQTAMLNQTRTFNFKRLKERMGYVNKTDFENIKEAYLRLFR
ncbi:type II toxin-antitoxin system PemK/MazF family toxin [Patescibacteria group bacterium]|nr:type II toxin-antitoxin system PemK/MazF family toxin [Patescibacteria group bacterium]